jgi:hypothetical protein
MFSSIHWTIAATLSGMIESFFALLAFVYWYSYSVTHWAKDAVYSAINGGARIPPNTEGFAAFALMFLHPVTWLNRMVCSRGDGPVSRSSIHWERDWNSSSRSSGQDLGTIHVKCAR